MRLESLSLVDISLRRSTKQDEIVPRLFNGVKQKRLRLEKFTARSPLQQFKINTRVFASVSLLFSKGTIGRRWPRQLLRGLLRHNSSTIVEPRKH